MNQEALRVNFPGNPTIVQTHRAPTGPNMPTEVHLFGAAAATGSLLYPPGYLARAAINNLFPHN